MEYFVFNLIDYAMLLLFENDVPSLLNYIGILLTLSVIYSHFDIYGLLFIFNYLLAYHNLT